MNENEKEILRQAMEMRGMTQTNISEILRYQTIKAQALARLLDTMGFDLIIKDRNGSNRENV